MRKQTLLLAAAAGAAMATATTAQARPGDPVAIAEGITLDPIVGGVLRYEAVSQDDIDLDADAVTIGMVAGAELKAGDFSILAEAEGTLSLVDDFNDTIAGNNGYPGAEPYSIVADPETVELNRLQVGYATKDLSLTVGRQRIALGNQRFVGNVGWRQNEQTFDAVRATAKFGPAYFDATYSISQRTIYGADAGARTAFDGNHIFANAGVKVAGVDLTGFAYLLDYDNDEPVLATSSQTYGAVATGGVPIGARAKLNFLASYARQSDYGDNPVDYSAEYINAELGTTVAGASVKGGYEKLGSDNGLKGFSTPMATLHAFNGFADLFLNTPNAGIEDYYASLGYAFKGIAAGVTYHKFESDTGGLDYGQEWDATVAFKLAGYPLLVKYANYDADYFGTDTEKLWIQISFAY